MSIIISDISAWQYWRTPPMLRDMEMDLEIESSSMVADCGLGSDMLWTRRDAREADYKTQARMFAELKGVEFPVHVMVEDSAGLRPSRFTVPHAIPAALPPSHMVPLGAGLYVLSPEATLCLMNRDLSAVQLAKMICEACGIFSLAPQTGRMRLVIDDLIDRRILTAEAFRFRGIFGYSDEKGRPLSTLDANGDPLDWIPSFGRRGQLTDLWKRAPLTSVDDVKAFADAIGLGNRHIMNRALSMSANGLASPAEVKAYLLLCSGTINGGESWGSPDLNRRIYFTPEASKLAHQSYCVADILWPSHRADLEIQSQEFHSDDLGYRLESGRTSALESMGYSVAELTYEQMADLELFEAVLPTLAKKTGFALCRRTVPFLKRRNRLHAELFGEAYEPCL